MSIQDYRLLIIDKDGQGSRRICDFLNEKGFEADNVQTGEMGIEKIKVWNPKYVICDMLLPDMNAFELLDLVKADDSLKNKGIKFLVTSSHNSVQNIKTAIQKGAVDYILKPIKPENLLPRLVFHAQKKRQVVEGEGTTAAPKLSAELSGGDLYMHLLSLVLKEATNKKSEHEMIFNMTKMLAMTLKAVRCSIIQCESDRETGFVRASHDDANVNEIKIDLNRYPEVLDVMNKEQIVVIENLDSDPVLAEIKKNFKSISFNSMIVCPLYKRGHFYGVVSARLDNKAQNFTDQQIRFSLLMSYIISLVLSSQIPLPIEFKRPA